MSEAKRAARYKNAATLKWRQIRASIIAAGAMGFAALDGAVQKCRDTETAGNPGSVVAGGSLAVAIL